MKRCCTMAIITAVLALAAGSAVAQEIWNGGGGDDLLSNAGNWTNGVRPEVSDKN
jgi:hypothetical protein